MLKALAEICEHYTHYDFRNPNMMSIVCALVPNLLCNPMLAAHNKFTGARVVTKEPLRSKRWMRRGMAVISFSLSPQGSWPRTRRCCAAQAETRRGAVLCRHSHAGIILYDANYQGVYKDLRTHYVVLKEWK